MNTTLKTIIAAALLTVSFGVAAKPIDGQTIVATVSSADTNLVNCSASGGDESIKQQVESCLCMINGLTQVEVFKTRHPEQWMFTAFYNKQLIHGYVVIVSHH